MISRRAFVIGTSALVACTNDPPAAPALESAGKRIEAIEADIGGRLGVCALDMSSGGRIVHRAAERFAMCSTFKWMLVASIMARADRGLIELDDSIADLCEKTIVDSDNAAASTLLKRTGGPGGLTQFIRSIGDDTTRVDRDEPDVNENAPGDPRDTTTPEAMVASMKTILFGDGLADKWQKKILDMMERSKTGRKRLRAGFPKEWVICDKTGTGEHGAINDVAVAMRKYHMKNPILVACFTTEVKADLDAVELAHTRVAKIVTETFT
jgi:beta-lactamase class A